MNLAVNWKEHFAGPAANVILTTLGYLAPGDAHYEPCLTHPPEPHDSPRFREVLALLDRIKARTSTQPNIYPEFIDMFAAWKLGRTPWLETRDRLSELFQDYPDLSQGINMYLVHVGRLRLYTMPRISNPRDLIRATGYMINSYGMDARNQQDMASWVQRMASNESPPPSTWMLHRENWCRLAQELKCRDLKIVQFAHVNDKTDPGILIRRTELWVLSSRRYGNMQIMMVDDPLAAIHIALTHTCLISACHYMMFNGISFSRLFPTTSDQFAHLHPHPEITTRTTSYERPNIRCNPNSHLFSKHQYEDYVRIRRNTLTGAGLTSALMRGGFLWRLAFEVYHDNHSLDFSGILENMPFPFHRHRCYHGADAFTYDIPSANLEDMVCGTYVLVSSVLGTQSQVVSWYPHAGAYVDTCIDSGRWTPLAEELFQAIYTDQSRSGAQPRSQGWWRQYFKRYHRTANKVLITCRKAVREFLVEYAEEV